VRSRKIYPHSGGAEQRTICFQNSGNEFMDTLGELVVVKPIGRNDTKKLDGTRQKPIGLCGGSVEYFRHFSHTTTLSPPFVHSRNDR